jgi:penicillin-binding protein 1A
MRRLPDVQHNDAESSKLSANELAGSAGCNQRNSAEFSKRTLVGQLSADEAGKARFGHAHTPMAIRGLLIALIGDLAAVGHSIRSLLSRARAKQEPLNAGEGDQRGEKGRGGRRGPLVVAFVKGMVASALVTGLVITTGILWALHDTRIAGKALQPGWPSLVLEAADGRPLGRTGSLAEEAVRSDFPDAVVNAVISVEDRRFYQHIGVDPIGILRAASANFDAGGIVEGGSTITQQLVRLRRVVGREQSIERKLREAFAALWLDFRMDKDAILTEYLNRIYLGAGTYGVPAAARMYFGKRLAELSLAEAAMLAGLIKAPSEYNPTRNLEAARRRAAQVLDAMVEARAIDTKAAAAAKAAPAEVKASAQFTPATSWFADWIAKHEYPRVSGASTRSIKVRTTLVPELQQAAERVIAEAFSVPRRGGPTQAALVAMRPDGAVLAMIGGRDYDRSQFNRAADARRQPGSAFKLFVWLAALRSGYSLNDIVDASPIRIKNWEPGNFGGRRYGAMTLEQAFAQSVNTAAVRLGTEVGLDKVVTAARDLGIDAPLPTLPSLPLGTAELTLVDLTGAFASVRAGRRVDPFGIIAFGPENENPRTLGLSTGKALAYQHELTALLRSVVTSGTGRRAASSSFIAGKTGTSQDHRDACFIGFNESLVVGVWVGHDDHSPMRGVTGGSVPVQIWRRFVEAAGSVAWTGPYIDAERMAAPLETADMDEPSSMVDASGLSRAATGAGSQCDREACSDAYDSFRASDCTYQPYRGARRMCSIPPATGAPEASMAQIPANPSCNIDVCSRRYRSFDATDCTYQPYGGGSRRFCDADR